MLYLPEPPAVHSEEGSEPWRQRSKDDASPRLTLSDQRRNFPDNRFDSTRIPKKADLNV